MSASTTSRRCLPNDTTHQAQQLVHMAVVASRAVTAKSSGVPRTLLGTQRDGGELGPVPKQGSITWCAPFGTRCCPRAETRSWVCCRRRRAGSRCTWASALGCSGVGWGIVPCTAARPHVSLLGGVWRCAATTVHAATNTYSLLHVPRTQNLHTRSFLRT